MARSNAATARKSATSATSKRVPRAVTSATSKAPKQAPTSAAPGRLHVVYRKTAELIPYARNSRTHNEQQVAQIAASIREFGFTNPVLVDEQSGIIAGHGRVLAAQLLELAEVPTIMLAGLSETQRRAYVIADNKLALNAGWDLEMLSLELQALTEAGFAKDLLGFTEAEMQHILEGWEPSGEPDATEPNDDPLKAVIRVRCNVLDSEDVRETLRRALSESGIEDVQVLDG